MELSALQHKPWAVHVPKQGVRHPEAGICQWELEQMALGIWPEQELSIPAWLTRWVTNLFLWIKGINKERFEIPTQVCSKSPRRHLLSASLLCEDNKEWHHNLPVPSTCPFPPNTFGKRRNCSDLEVSSTPFTLSPKLPGFVWAVLFPHLILFRLRLKPSPGGCHGSKVELWSAPAHLVLCFCAVCTIFSLPE